MRNYFNHKTAMHLITLTYPGRNTELNSQTVILLHTSYCQTQNTDN